MPLLVGWVTDVPQATMLERNHDRIKSWAIRKEGDMIRCVLCSTMWWMGHDGFEHQSGCPAGG